MANDVLASIMPLKTVITNIEFDSSVVVQNIAAGYASQNQE